MAEDLTKTIPDSCIECPPVKKWDSQRLDGILERLLDTYRDGRGINQVEGLDLPSVSSLYRILDNLFAILFPGFREEHAVTQASLPHHVGHLLNQVYGDLVVEVEKAYRYECRVKQCDTCRVKDDAEGAVLYLLDSLSTIRQTLLLDVKAAMEGDPAVRSFDEVILTYPCIQAIATYRLAHELYERKVPLIPRIWTERAHSRTGIDINPGARIGPSFFIDHGTGVVIGETCEIGAKVSIYQGVTLGALAPAKGQRLAGKKRHPTIEDNVIIYAGATILGGGTVIGKGSVIGGNVWLTQSVPPATRVLLPRTDYVFVGQEEQRGEGKIKGESTVSREGAVESGVEKPVAV